MSMAVKDGGRLVGKTILVIEDDYLIGQQVADVLTMEGAAVLGPFGWLEEAEAAATGAPAALDAALVDINLHGEKSYPAVDILLSRGIPVILMTGYGPGSIEADYAACRHFAKPFSRNQLIEALLS